MANKRFYWMKLNENFFNINTILYLKRLDNGNDCIVFFLELCLNTLNDEGLLIEKFGNKIIPHDVKSISQLTRNSIEDTSDMLNILIDIGLIEILEDETMFIPLVKDCVGSESSSAKRMRNKRARDKEKEENENSSINNNKILDNKIIDIRSDVTKMSQCDALSKKPYGNYGNVLLSNEEYSELLEAHRQHKLDLCIKVLDEYIESTGKKYNNHTPVINGWVIDTVNKGIREGKYPKEEVSQEGYNDFLNLITPQLEDYLENPF